MRSNVTRLVHSLQHDRWPLVPLRLIVGFGFAAHGLSKLERGPEHFAAILAAMHVPMPSIAAWAISGIELAGGVSLMVGAAVRPWTFPLATTMAGAVLGVHARYGFLSIRLRALTPTGAEFGPIGYELNLLYIAALLALALAGTTPLSVDRWREGRGSASRRREPGRDGELDPGRARDRQIENA